MKPLRLCVLGKRSITPETALVLEDALGMTAEFWLQLQAEYDIDVARKRIAAKPRSTTPLAPLHDYDPALDAEPW